MTNDERWARWSEIERVLDLVLEQPASLRGAFLDSICAGDPELRTAVDRLLVASEADSPMLDSPASEQVAALNAILERQARPTPGSRLGTYEVIRELGRGGMATVFLARDHKHERDVALKVLHAELAAMVGAERFLQEIRVTARLGHPHIITLIDSGETDGFLWYVIPSIPGASLRERLDASKRLDVEEALTIARQIGGALDYAHRQGVIHRDIKPENILLHEGEAMLADFGIALAVQEAGGTRLTSSGVPIGTPQYMSPEQAKGETVDAQSDVFSFGAVVYEMLAGSAPHAATTSREVIERLLNEPPPMLREARREISTHVEAAVAKALAKEPGERFASPGDFVRALGALPPAPIHRKRTLAVAVLVGGVVVSAGLLLSMKRPPGGTPAVRDRTKLTFTGEAIAPAISADGSELAYVVRQCASTHCSYAIETQRVGGGSSIRVMDGWSAVYRMAWSPDQRYLIVDGTYGRRFGSHLISASGIGVPRLLAAGPRTRATFIPGTDSILIGNRVSADGIVWLHVMATDGGYGDSIPVERSGAGLIASRMLAGRRWIVVAANAAGSIEWRIIDRRGKQYDVFSTRVGVSTWLSDRLAQDALWLLLTSSPSLERRLVRLGIDARYGKFRGGPDTVLLVTEEPYDISEDGKAVVHGEGTYRYDTWGLALDEALRGEFLPPRHLKSSTSILDTRISPDGKHVLVAGQRESAFLVPFEGGDLRLLGSSSLVSQFGWMPDTNLLWFAERVGRFLHVQTADPITVKRQRVFSIDGPSIRETTPIVGGGWVWVAPPGAGILQVQLPEDSAPRSVRKPNDVSGIRNIISASDRARALMTGWNATGDSVLMYDISLRDGSLTRLASFFGEEENATWLADGSILVAVQETIGIASIYRVRGPGRIEQVGVVPRPIGHRGHIFASLDGRRLGVTTEQYHGDIWLAKVSLTR